MRNDITDMLDRLQERLEYFNEHRQGIDTDVIIRDILQTYNRHLDRLQKEQQHDEYILYRQWRNNYECDTHGEGI